ncbi:MULTISPECIES: DUF7024 domain-containing protein [Legionella]|uniref:Phosphoglycerol transferase I n=1 Tax=Legionella drozanskii LLAP-1 TaxID=1212489 RepID=A0A0W0SMN5_9GAMM|nr:MULTISPECIES: hypothetical protein [Legionella]KTC84679.1 phosphoglycerol transferase I [Legionella drozanskii LLAP-1]PJE07886.1 MAG: sugar translocase [Legionella sp.]
MQENLSHHLSFWHPMRHDWKWLLIGSVFSVLFASILLSGWPSGLIPHLDYPYTYGGDTNFTSWLVQRVREGWLFDNPRSGYPFGSNFLDYPQSDNGSIFALKLLGILTNSYYGALNIYLLLSFPLAFIASFLVLKALSFRNVYAFSTALLFTFTPFHFWRFFGHIFYTWYFVVPIYFYYSWKIFLDAPSIWPFSSLKKFILLFGAFIILSSFGVYYAFFGIISFVVCGFASAIKDRTLKGLTLSIIFSGMVACGVGLNILPNLIYQHKQGPNVEVAHREPKQTETYGLKIAPLLFPTSNHRIAKLSQFVNAYSKYYEVTEAVYSESLGILGSVGLLVLLVALFAATLGKQVDPRLRFFSLLVLAYLLIANTGGLSVLFALIVSPAIRGWNRISIFISFAALAALFLVLQQNKKIEALYKGKKLVYSAIPLVLLLLGLFDQTPSSYTALTTSAKNRFIEDRDFIKKIEAMLPPGSAIYQLPYMGFPEYGNNINLADYDLLAGYLNSNTLRWTYAGMKGRKGDLFYRYLSKESIDKQLEVIKRLGFAGIYIDRNGFADQAKALVDRLNALEGGPTLVRKDDRVLFYRITPSTHTKLDSMSFREIMEQAGYIITESGPSYPATLSEGIDFSHNGVPIFIKDIKGLSGVESWGRWSDAKLAPSVRLDFTEPLPNQFDLVLSTTAYGPNVDHKLKIVVGTETYNITLHDKLSKSKLAIDLKGEKVSSIELTPPFPSKFDSRILGFGLAQLKVIDKLGRKSL